MCVRVSVCAKQSETTVSMVSSDMQKFTARLKRLQGAFVYGSVPRFASEGTTMTSENRPSGERTRSDEPPRETGGGRGRGGGGRAKPKGFAEKRTEEMRRRSNFWEGVSAGQARRRRHPLASSHPALAANARFGPQVCADNTVTVSHTGTVSVQR